MVRKGTFLKQKGFLKPAAPDTPASSCAFRAWLSHSTWSWTRRAQLWRGCGDTHWLGAIVWQLDQVPGIMTLVHSLLLQSSQNIYTQCIQPPQDINQHTMATSRPPRKASYTAPLEDSRKKTQTQDYHQHSQTIQKGATCVCQNTFHKPC